MVGEHYLKDWEIRFERLSPNLSNERKLDVFTSEAVVKLPQSWKRFSRHASWTLYQPPPVI